ncbi:nucleotidyltransferase domain-containing protein [Actinomadura rayongensis]|uniref:Nucleotidyltransferase domain-containing protein n=1 Tax=Actinomadura rayongensis TaxID=1429076 RepID=A0A6I4WN36_9ACTN|nr:nucleotidyltransferase domain-containing protein [Actinomadura rayongensis]
MLLHDVDAAAGTVRSLARERAVSSRYAAYQRQLHDHVHRLIERDRHTAVVVGDRSVLAVQDELRALLAGGHPVLPDGALRDVQLVALGGLSESGKSTAGEYLRTRHAYARLKIGWLIRTAADLADLADPYACTPQVQAELLVDALDRYCAAHPYLDRVTIESLHRFEATAELRRLLGKQLTVLYLDAHADVRAARGTAGPGDVAERDIVKSERGAARVADLADEVIDNNRSSVALRHRLDQIALAARWPLRRPVPIAVGELGLPVRLAAYLTALLDQVTGEPAAVDLLAVTGSGARRTYRDGWSDLDVFVVAEPAGLPRLRQALDDLRDGLGGVKLGVTAVTAAECRSAAITPRLLHVLTLLGDGDYAPLWCRPGLSLPAPSPADDAAASAADAASAAIEIRRQLLHGAPDLRKLYKTTALLAKLILRILGTSQREHENDDSALVALLHDEPQNGPHDADPGQWAQRQRQARTDRATATTMATLVLDRWLSTFPQAGRS